MSWPSPTGSGNVPGGCDVDAAFMQLPERGAQARLFGLTAAFRFSRPGALFLLAQASVDPLA